MIDIYESILRKSRFINGQIGSLILEKPIFIWGIALKKIKSLFNLQTDPNAEHADDSQTASETARDESEEHRE